MSWSFTYVGTFEGVKTAVRKLGATGQLPPAMEIAITTSIDRLVKANETITMLPKGVRVSSHGHDGSVGKLEIELTRVELDPPIAGETPSQG